MQQLAGRLTQREPAGRKPLSAAQQPDWHAHPDHGRVRGALLSARPLVSAAEVEAAREALAAVASGSALVLQAGDCAESFADSTPARTRAKVAVLGLLAEHLGRRTSQDVVRFGRMAGQYAKPRSRPTETVDGAEIPVYRGDLVNSAVPDVQARQHDPHRMLLAYGASAKVMGALRGHRREEIENPGSGEGWRGPWSSHEALVLDYESALVRTDPATGRRFLASTHFPWAGARTRQPEGAHVRLLSSVGNPVGCKIEPSATPQEVLRLCEVLDPDRVPGRLTLVVRMGKASVTEALPPIVRAVRRSGHPVVWLSDPMHGNTVRTGSGIKTRHLRDLVEEARRFRHVVEDAGMHAGGLHLEVASGEVTECLGGPVRDEAALEERYESLCDPRLNPVQALELIDAVF